MVQKFSFLYQNTTDIVVRVLKQSLPKNRQIKLKSEYVPVTNCPDCGNKIRKEKQMSKHTPGPWKITHTALNGYRVSDSTGWGVAIVLKDVNDKANAQLIAAAPQMLEALERLCEAARALDEQISTVHDKIVITDAISLLRLQNAALSAVKQAEAAIATAKGEV